MGPYVKKDGEKMTTVSVRLSDDELLALDELVGNFLDRKIARLVDGVMSTEQRELIAGNTTATRSDAVRDLIMNADGWTDVDGSRRRRSGKGGRRS